GVTGRFSLPPGPRLRAPECKLCGGRAGKGAVRRMQRLTRCGAVKRCCRLVVHRRLTSRAVRRKGKRYSKHHAVNVRPRAASNTVASKPPFRAEHIGSLLRPPELMRKRALFARGEISQIELTIAEDEAIRGVIEMQQQIGF